MERPGHVYVINDNERQQFDFEKLAQGETWATRDALLKVGVNNPPFAPGAAPDRRALASVKPTDVLVFGIQTWPVGVSAVPLALKAVPRCTLLVSYCGAPPPCASILMSAS